MNNWRVKTSFTKYTSHFIGRVWKGYSRFACERELVTETNWNILTPTLMAVNVVSFSFSWCSTGGPGVHSAGCWLSLVHISNFSGPQTPSGLPRAPSAECGFPYHISSITYSPTVTGTRTVSLLSWLSYIIVQRPLDRLLDLWNGMIDRHPAVQRSLSSGASVYECIMGFTLSHFISQIHPRDLFRLLAIGMCHFLPMHHFVMACLLGPKVKIQHFQ